MPKIGSKKKSVFSPESMQQFSEILEDSEDQSNYAESREGFRGDKPIKLHEGLWKIEQRIMAK